MIKLTEILSKPVISLNNCKTEGFVINAIFDKNFKRLKFLLLFDNEEHQDEKALLINKIYNYGENAIVVKDSDYLTLSLSSIQVEDKPSVINCSCYTYLGNFIGKINDIILDDKFYIQSLIVGNKTINALDIITTGKDIVIIQDENKKVKVSSLKRKTKKCIQIQDIKVQPEQKVYILNNEENKSIKPEITENEILENKNEEENLEKNLVLNNDNNTVKPPKIKYQLTETPPKPAIITTNFEFLIGRKLEQNIYSQNKELIAKKNTRITTDIINKARLLNKTRELVKFSK